MNKSYFIYIIIFYGSLLEVHCQKIEDLIPVNRIEIEADSVNSEFIKRLISDDLIEILEYDKIFYSDISETDERIVYIDYRNNSNLKDEVSNIDSELKQALFEGNYFPKGKSGIQPESTRSIDKLNQIYLPVRMLKGHYLLFEYDIIYGSVLSDSIYASKGMEGWYVSKIKNRENINKLELSNSDEESIEIKTLETNPSVQIWKSSGRHKQGEYEHYQMYISIKNALELPVLCIMSTGDLDDVYDHFDEVNLEEIFNKVGQN